MSDIQELIAEIESQGWLTETLSTAVYPCSGTDTKAFTFTHPEFYAHRGVHGVPSPNVFLYIDKADPFDKRNPSFRFSDGQTCIETHSSKSISLGRKPGYQFDVIWESVVQPEWMKVKERHLVVIYLVSEWRDFPQYMRSWHWVPDTFIGVCDGCRFGGNPECVNNLTTHGLPETVLRSIPVSRYHVTDHFGHSRRVDMLQVGDCISSTDPRFPYQFRKLALLSGDWGHYGRRGVIGGAMLFEVVPTTAQ